MTALDTSMILAAVCKEFGCTLANLRGSRGTPSITGPRQVAAYLIRIHLQLSYPEIGRILYKDHTTIIAAVRRVWDKMKGSAVFTNRVEKIEARLKQLQDPSLAKTSANTALLIRRLESTAAKLRADADAIDLACAALRESST